MFKISGFFQFSLRNYASPNRVKKFQQVKRIAQIEAEAISLKSKGFLRSQKPYKPPAQIKQKVLDLVQQHKITDFKQQKFLFLNECAKFFNGHAVPNSRLHEMTSIGDVIKFYRTPVDCRTPYEKLDKTIANLHVIPEAKRYNPETDGISAFPKSSTLVTSLKHRNKYKGHIAKTSWP